jgi:hypothetical protein
MNRNLLKLIQGTYSLNGIFLCDVESEIKSID